MGASFGSSGAYRLTSWQPPQPIGQLRRVRLQRARKLWRRVLVAVAVGLAASLLQVRAPVAALWQPAAVRRAPAPPPVVPASAPQPAGPRAAAPL